jgi:hypothetical protein
MNTTSVMALAEFYFGFLKGAHTTVYTKLIDDVSMNAETTR